MDRNSPFTNQERDILISLKYHACFPRGLRHDWRKRETNFVWCVLNATVQGPPSIGMLCDRLFLFWKARIVQRCNLIGWFSKTAEFSYMKIVPRRALPLGWRWAFKITSFHGLSLTSLMAHTAGAYPGFRSMKQLGVLLLHLDGMLVHHR